MGSCGLPSSTVNGMGTWRLEDSWRYRGEVHGLESIGFDPRARGELVGGRFVCGGRLLFEQMGSLEMLVESQLRGSGRRFWRRCFETGVLRTDRILARMVS